MNDSLLEFVHFNDPDAEPPAPTAPPFEPPPSLGPTPPGRSLSAPANGRASEAEWMFRESDNRYAMFLAAQAAYAEAVTHLSRAAETLCPEAWDKLRQGGQDASRLTPAHIADLVIQSVQRTLRLADLSRDPSSAVRIESLIEENAALRREAATLRQRADTAEEAARVLRDQQIAEALRRKDASERRAQTVIEQSRIKARQQRQRLEQESHTANASGAPAEAAPTSEQTPATAVAAPVSLNDERINDLVSLMASTGLSRSKDIRPRLAAKWGIAQDKNAQQYIALAGERGLITGVVFDSDFVGAPKLSLLKLTPAGEQAARALGVALVRSQLDVGLAVHKSPEQVYAVLEIADILAECGYVKIDPFPAAEQSDGMRYHPDLTAVDPETGEILLVEYERPTFKRDAGSRETKWSRAGRFGNGTVYLVTPDNSILAVIVREVQETSAGMVKQVQAFSLSEYRKGERGNRAVLWTAYEIE